MELCPSEMFWVNFLNFFDDLLENHNFSYSALLHYISFKLSNLIEIQHDILIFLHSIFCIYFPSSVPLRSLVLRPI